MRRLAIGSIAIVLLASLHCEPQETKAGPLTRLRQASILVAPLNANAKTLGFSLESLESQMLVGLRRDIPKLALSESARPTLYTNVNVGAVTTVGGRESGFSVCVTLEMIRPVSILEDVGFDEVTLDYATVWNGGQLLVGSRRDIRQMVKDAIDELLTVLAAHYYRQNPQ